MNNHGHTSRCTLCKGPIADDGQWMPFLAFEPGISPTAESNMSPHSSAAAQPGYGNASTISPVGCLDTSTISAANASLGPFPQVLRTPSFTNVTSILGDGFGGPGSVLDFTQSIPHGSYQDEMDPRSPKLVLGHQVDTNGSSQHQAALHSVETTVINPGTTVERRTTSYNDGVNNEQDVESANVQTKACAYCRKQFRRIPDLNRHIKSHDPDKRVHKCSVQGCDYKGSYRKDKLTEHMKKRHAGGMNA